MNFVDELNSLPLDALHRIARGTETAVARQALARSRPSLPDFAALISPGAAELLEPMCRRSQALTRQRFGRVIRMFAPVYISNQCVNNCRYCGFARRNNIARVTLSIPEVEREANAVVAMGFRSILLVASEHPKLVTPAYLADCVRAVVAKAPDVCIEIAPWSVADYKPVVEAGAEGVIVFQETYDRGRYAEMHPSGPKRDMDWRLGTPERAYAAGFRKLGLGALMGLNDWRREAICLAAHAVWLLKHCWKAQISISLPRIRPAASGFVPVDPINDRDLAQLIAAYRLMFPDAHLVLSTREPARLRDGLIPLGITQISAGSHTEPGGYTGAGRENIERIHLEPVAASSAAAAGATAQFNIADERSAAEVAASLRRMRLDPVWKDWDAGFCQPPARQGSN
jgi:2-iminoacetate synthase